MARTDGCLSQGNGQALTAITDAPSQWAQLKVSGEPTPHDKGQQMFGSMLHLSALQISPKVNDLWVQCTDFLVTKTRLRPSFAFLVKACANYGIRLKGGYAGGNL